MTFVEPWNGSIEPGDSIEPRLRTTALINSFTSWTKITKILFLCLLFVSIFSLLRGLLKHVSQPKVTLFYGRLRIFPDSHVNFYMIFQDRQTSAFSRSSRSFMITDLSAHKQHASSAYGTFVGIKVVRSYHSKLSFPILVEKFEVWTVYVCFLQPGLHEQIQRNISSLPYV